jgi:hypothetical protein
MKKGKVIAEQREVRMMPVTLSYTAVRLRHRESRRGDPKGDRREKDHV